MGKVNEFRALLKKDPVTAAMICPSSRFEICMDVNGDGKADFAFIDSSCDFTGNGPMDTFGIDLGLDGEFDLYLRDSDANFVPDQVYYVADGAMDEGQKSTAEHHDLIEGVLKEPSMAFAAAITAFARGQADGNACKAAMQQFVAGLCSGLQKLH